jgi:hypothetical protein
LGGKESIRGFLYQGFASVLEALTQDFWEKIHVEYPVGNKVDIALESKCSLIKSIQVKSSINLFTKNSILTWLNELIEDAISKEYSICLIGPCDEDANTLINSISKYQAGTKDAKSKRSLEGFNTTILDRHDITISVLPFEETYLQGIVRDALHKYISFKNYTLEYSCLEIISKSILMTQMLLGTKGKGISKEDFDKKIFKWLETTSGGTLKNSLQKANHKLIFYNQETGKCSDSMSESSIIDYYNYKQYLNTNVDACNNLIAEIDGIKLPSHEDKKVEEPGSKETLPINTDTNSKSLSTLNLKRINNSFNVNSIKINKCNLEFFNQYAEISDTEKEKLIRDIKDLFNIDVEKEFFYVGNLKKEMKTGVFGGQSYEYNGNKTEEHKNDLINHLQSRIFLYKTITRFVNNISKCSVLPIAIHNTSNNSDQNITIKLYLNKSNTKLFQGCDYPKDDYVLSLPKLFCEEDGIIGNIFGLKPDCNISVEAKKI